MFNSKITLLLLLTLFCSGKLKAQNEVYNKASDRRAERYMDAWKSLIPRYGKIQFAGSMGMFSIGTGWNYGKDRWETDLLFGIVPKDTHNVSHESAKHLKTFITFTLKQNYMPWKVNINKDFMFEPLACGIYFNTLLNSDFWTKQPAKYPKGYYFFSTKIRTNIYLGERITYKIDSRRKVTFFYELSTCDLYLLVAVKNKVLKPSDYLGLSLGVKLQIL